MAAHQVCCEWGLGSDGSQQRPKGRRSLADVEKDVPGRKSLWLHLSGETRRWGSGSGDCTGLGSFLTLALTNTFYWLFIEQT